MTSKPEQPVDERLLHAHDLALSALHEITPADTVGPPADYLLEDGGVVSLRFHTRLLGYPGWYWTVSVAVVDDAEPTVLEAELMPGEGALLAPDWVPWATRLADYQAAQAAAAESDESEDDEDLDDEDDLDDDDLDDTEDDDAEDDDADDEPKARFHAGDLDGVDIDELDEEASDEEASDEDDTDEDDTDVDDEDEHERSY
ncbi:primase [Microbacterium testaceum]|uniref:Primase n=1 Tax=Microbacterium testaceum TaxID=2033 RepID=A0A147ETC4_MICTE|nr:DUF3027 domain-containing protein [Microbacterium testaceum]KTR87604.1 primase [Microbacterium testaceum]